jgi:osmoprotectant transport system ATP-binding protein
MGDGRDSAGAVVELRNVTKRYDRNLAGAGAVNELSFTVPAGEICVLVGPSGCGKTTTLRMVNRLVEPSSGQVLIDGSDVATVEPTQLRRRIGYVIQQIGLFPHQSIAQNVGTVPSLLGWDKQRSAARVDELLSLVGLDPDGYRSRYPAELSGGERQRVGVARALAAEPPVMLMDEPFGAVDPIVREHLQDEFLRLHRTLGMTVILVTHDIDEAIKMGTRVAVMRQGGYLEQYAPPAELLAHPASDFVAQFVGSDRALKQLALLSMSDVVPTPLVDLLGDGATPPDSWPRLKPQVLLRDALSDLLITDEHVGVALDSDGGVLGGVTLESIGAVLSQDRSPNGHIGVTPDEIDR